MDITRYLYHLDQNLETNLEDPDYEMPADWLYSAEAALQLAEYGFSLWGHPGWESDLGRLVNSPTIAIMDRLEVVASFLVAACPPTRQDSELCGNLRYIADRSWAVIHEGSYSIWPRLSLRRSVPV